MKLTQDIIKNIVSENEANLYLLQSLTKDEILQLDEILYLSCLATTNEEALISSGIRLYQMKLPFGDLIIILEQILTHFTYTDMSIFVKNRNTLTLGYASQKLAYDKKITQTLIDETNNLLTGENNRLSMLHNKWFVKWIEYLENRNIPIEFDPSMCEIGQWINQKEKHQSFDKKLMKMFEDNHRIGHIIAQSALKMYDIGEYYSFMQLYLDLRSYVMRNKDELQNIFLHEKLVLMHMDNQTTLYNRIPLLEDLQNNREDTLLIFNIKDFSKINLLYGYKYGDKLLAQIGLLLNECPHCIKAYRVFADEFAALIDNAGSAEDILSFVEQSIAKDSDLDGIALSLYGSITDLIHEDPLGHAEFALLVAKKEKKRLIDCNQIAEGLVSKFTNNLSIAQRLRGTIESDGIIPYYQPIYELKSGKIVKYEALMRIVDTPTSVLTPDKFLPVLQTMYIYTHATKMMIKKSFELFKDRKEGFSINMSMSDIESSEVGEYLESMLRKYPDAGKRLTIELLEDEAVKNFEKVNNFFERMRSYEVVTALDDFGAGFSNFAYLFNLKIDIIKIDGSIIKNITNPKMFELAKTIIQMARVLKIKTVAEFVYDEEILGFVKKLGIDYAQGYAIGKPEPLPID